MVLQAQPTVQCQLTRCSPPCAGSGDSWLGGSLHLPVLPQVSGSLHESASLHESRSLDESGPLSGSWQWDSGAPWPSDSPSPPPSPGHCLTLGEEGAWGAAPCGEARGVICEIVRELAGEEGGATGRSDLNLGGTHHTQ